MKTKLLTVNLIFFVAVLSCVSVQDVVAQEKPATDATAPLHLSQPDYLTPYGVPEISDVKGVLDRVLNYLDEVTPAKILNAETNEEIASPQQATKNTVLQKGDFRLTSYEWGVTYAGMLLAGEVTGDEKYTNYTVDRLKFLSELAAVYRENPDLEKNGHSPVHSMLHPGALDDAGAVCAAFIKTERLDEDSNFRPVIDNFIDYIHNKELRLEDGTLCRNRPLPNTLWLDDLFMSVPALAQMGKLTGENKYFDDAVKQVLQFSERMFNHQKGLYMHGWVQDMSVHPQFHWGRANGWAVMTLVELLEVLPENHSGYQDVLEQLQAHVKGLAAFQHGTGFWHQLIDRPDTYLETSATAIYAYSMARAINRGYIDATAYTPVVFLAWNAVSTKINDKGQVEGTCVGTGMGFDPAFYYYRPVNTYAAHGYGPVLLAGAEMISLLKDSHARINDSAVMFYPEKVEAEGAIFSVD